MAIRCLLCLRALQLNNVVSQVISVSLNKLHNKQNILTIVQVCHRAHGSSLRQTTRYFSHLITRMCKIQIRTSNEAENVRKKCCGRFRRESYLFSSDGISSCLVRLSALFNSVIKLRSNNYTGFQQTAEKHAQANATIKQVMLPKDKKVRKANLNTKKVEVSTGNSKANLHQCL